MDKTDVGIGVNPTYVSVSCFIKIYSFFDMWLYIRRNLEELCAWDAVFGIWRVVPTLPPAILHYLAKSKQTPLYNYICLSVLALYWSKYRNSQVVACSLLAHCFRTNKSCVVFNSVRNSGLAELNLTLYLTWAVLYVLVHLSPLPTEAVPWRFASR